MRVCQGSEGCGFDEGIERGWGCCVGGGETKVGEEVRVAEEFAVFAYIFL